MMNGYRVVCVTPAGRRRYLRLLLPYVLSCAKVDRYDLWVNTPDPADVAFLEAVAEVDERIHLVKLPPDVPPGPGAIREIWPSLTESDTVYIRFDDDIVWVDPSFFDTLLSFRLANPQFFTVAPLIINNAMSTYLLQTFRRITISRPVGPDRFDRIGWVDPTLAQSLHGFFQELINTNETARLCVGQVPVSGNCFSINCISWFGADVAAVGGRIPIGEDEEAAASCTFALRAGRLNCFETAAIASHFAFYTQRETMDRSPILEGYLQIAARRSELQPWRDRVESAYREIEKRHPIHLSLGGFKPLSRRKKLWIRRILKSRQKNELPAVTVERGPEF